MNTPTEVNAKVRAQHYQSDHSCNTYVVAPMSDIRGKASYDWVPGFYLIDQNFILQSDSTGHYPKHNLWRQIL